MISGKKKYDTEVDKYPEKDSEYLVHHPQYNTWILKGRFYELCFNHRPLKLKNEDNFSLGVGSSFFVADSVSIQCQFKIVT